MKNSISNWWRNRLDKYYLRKRWYIIADIILLAIIVTLFVVFLSLYYIRIPVVNIEAINHVPQVNSDKVNDSLTVTSEIKSSNIYSSQEFTIKIIATNFGDKDINNLSLGLFLSSNKFSFSKIQGSSVTPDFKVINRKLALEKLSAGETKEIILSLIIKNVPDSSRLINWRLRGNYDQEGAIKKVEQALPDLKLISSLNVKAVAYYNSPLGDQLGSGPIPPQAFIPTNYWAFFTSENIDNNLSNLTVRAKLADHVTFYGRKTLTAGKLSYDDKRRMITWTVDSLNPNNSDYQAGFELQLLPAENQIGKEAPLLTDIIFSAHDVYTDEDILGRKPVINTDLPYDSINKGQGVVVE